MRFLVLPALVVLPGVALLPAPAAGQRPTQAQIEQLRENPELIRQQIEASGLTPDQIRSRLRAAGYPRSLLDAFLEEGDPSAPAAAVDATQLAAFQALGLPFAEAEALLPLDTGIIRAEELPRSRVFGVDAFRRSSTRFLPTLSGPVPPGYRLGPGDVLVLLLTGDVELTHTLPVTREGYVVIPQVGQVPVTNLTLDQFRALLYDRLGRVYSGVRRGPRATTHFDVSVATVRANQVYVIGEVTQPGSYQISALGTPLTALYAAGGVTERANMRRIVIRRNGTVVDSLDLYDYLLRGDNRGDVQLDNGDVVFVPIHGPRVEVTGAVRRPGVFELEPGERLSDLLDAAGGFTPVASVERVTIHRVLPAAQRGPGPAPRIAISVELRSDPADSGTVIPAFPLLDGDSLVVDLLPPLATTLNIGIAGMVLKPGTFPWREEMTLRDAMTLAGGPRIGADLREAEIARIPASRGSGELADTIRVPLDSSYLILGPARDYAGPPGPAFPAPGTAPEVILEPFDQILILRQPDFEFQRTVDIQGEVLYPGKYTLIRKDNRLSDLVRRAGGLQPTAYAEGARFFRELEGAGRVDIDLPRVLAEPSGAADILLQPGDSMFIPEYLPTVRVEGAVNSPTSVLYTEGRGLDYYIENAGGYSRLADKGRTSVRYANGSARTKSRFMFWVSSPEPGPGSVVFVPARPEDAGFNLTQFLAAVAQILASTVAIIAIATR